MTASSVCYPLAFQSWFRLNMAGTSIVVRDKMFRAKELALVRD
jgi:hypothetical protein